MANAWADGDIALYAGVLAGCRIGIAADTPVGPYAAGIISTAAGNDSGKGSSYCSNRNGGRIGCQCITFFIGCVSRPGWIILCMGSGAAVDVISAALFLFCLCWRDIGTLQCTMGLASATKPSAFAVGSNITLHRSLFGALQRPPTGCTYLFM